MGHPEIYTAEYYQRLYDLESRHWWHVGMRVVAAALLGSRGACKPGARVLDAGCGTGAAMTWAQEQLGAETVIGVDISPEALQLCRSRPGQQVLQGSVLEMPFENDSFDLVLCWNVLQHLPTDGGDLQALVEMRRVLRPGGALLVHANSRLGMWQEETARDDDFQRYVLPELVARMETAGFRVERATYANCLPALYASMLRWVQLRSRGRGSQQRVYEGMGVRDTPSRSIRLNRLLLRIVSLEARYLAGSNQSLAFGHSTFCLGRKPA